MPSRCLKRLVSAVPGFALLAVCTLLTACGGGETAISTSGTSPVTTNPAGSNQGASQVAAGTVQPPGAQGVVQSETAEATTQTGDTRSEESQIEHEQMPSPIAGQGYRLAWHDEFDDRQLDASRWNVNVEERREAINSRSAVTVDDHLVITTYSRNGLHYTGFIETGDLFKGRYGYYEARISYNPMPGSWCAFWLYTPTIATQTGNPAANGVEVDIAELWGVDGYGNDMRNQYHYAIHWDGYDESHQGNGSFGRLPDGGPLADNWHTYAVLWTPEEYVFYLNGIEQWRSPGVVSQVPQSIILSCEVESQLFAGTIPAGGFGARAVAPAKFRVDWVRVWQRD